MDDCECFNFNQDQQNEVEKILFCESNVRTVQTMKVSLNLNDNDSSSELKEKPKTFGDLKKIIGSKDKIEQLKQKLFSHRNEGNFIF